VKTSNKRTRRLSILPVPQPALPDGRSGGKTQKKNRKIKKIPSLEPDNLREKSGGENIQTDLTTRKSYQTANKIFKLARIRKDLQPSQAPRKTYNQKSRDKPPKGDREITTEGGKRGRQRGGSAHILGVIWFGKGVPGDIVEEPEAMRGSGGKKV